MTLFIYSLMAFICFFLLFLLEKNLHGKFVKFGNFQGKSLNLFIQKVGSPNQVEIYGHLKIVNWATHNNFIRQNYSITLVFDTENNFLYKANEILSQGVTPNIWVGVRF